MLVHAIAGARLEELKAQLPALRKRAAARRGCEYDVYPRELKEPYYGRRARVGNQLYASIGVAREDRPGAIVSSRATICSTMPRSGYSSRSIAPWARRNGPMSRLHPEHHAARRAHGLHTCPQEAWTAGTRR